MTRPSGFTYILGLCACSFILVYLKFHTSIRMFTNKGYAKYRTTVNGNSFDNNKYTWISKINNIHWISSSKQNGYICTCYNNVTILNYVISEIFVDEMRTSPKSVQLLPIELRYFSNFNLSFLLLDQNISMNLSSFNTITNEVAGRN